MADLKQMFPGCDMKNIGAAGDSPNAIKVKLKKSPFTFQYYSEDPQEAVEAHDL